MDVKKAALAEQTVITLLTQVSKALHRRTSEELLGMRLKQYLALGYIRDHQGTTQQELETGLLIDANRVVLLLNELEAGALSMRRRDPLDRRRHLLEITARGRAALEKADRARETLEEDVLGSLSPQERASFKSLLARVLDGLLQPVPERV